MTSDASFLPPESIARLQRGRWARQSAYLAARSPFYAGSDIPSRLEDLPAFPPTTKDALRRSQAACPPFGNYLAAPREDVVRLHRTSGTTGRPMNIALSRRDALQVAEAGARATRAAGVYPGLMLAHCLNYRLWMGGFTDHTTLEAAGATVIPFGVGGSDLLIRTIRELGVEALFCTVSYPAVLEQVLTESFPDLKPRDLGLKLALLTGEPGLENPSFRARIEDTWGFSARNVYGISDVLTVFAGQCETDDCLHYIAADLIYPELIDPDSGEVVPWADGSEGELVVTHLERECQPLVRFRTGDIIRLVALERCRCGREVPRFRVLGRADDMIVVRGVNVFPGAVAEVLNRFPELSGEFRFVLDGPPPYDRLPVEAELAPGTDHAEALGTALTGAIKQAVGASATVRLLPPNALPRTDGKTKRIVRQG